MEGRVTDAPPCQKSKCNSWLPQNLTTVDRKSYSKHSQLTVDRACIYIMHCVLAIKLDERKSKEKYYTVFIEKKSYMVQACVVQGSPVHT